MNKPININRIGEQIELESGKYKVCILGGWGVKLNEFSIAIKNIKTKEVTKSERAFWPVQSFAFRKRAKRIFIINVTETARYEVIFDNPETVKVKHSNLPLSSMFEDSLPNEYLEVCFR